MSESQTSAPALLREFFKILPDYSLCRVLAANVSSGVITHAHAVQLLQTKASQTALIGQAIREVLDKKKVKVHSEWRLLKDMTLEEINRLADAQFSEVLHFYFKHPLAHARVAQPSLFRTRASRLKFLYDLLAESQRRSLPTEYAAWEEMLSLL